MTLTLILIAFILFVVCAVLFESVVGVIVFILLIAYGVWNIYSILFNSPKIKELQEQGNVVRGVIVNYHTMPKAFWHDIRNPIVDLKLRDKVIKNLSADGSLSYRKYPIGIETDWLYLEKYPRLTIHKSEQDKPQKIKISLLLHTMMVLVCLYFTIDILIQIFA